MVVSVLSHTPSTCCTHVHRAAALGSGIKVSGLTNAVDLANSTSRITSLPNTLGGLTAGCLSSSPSRHDGRRWEGCAFLHRVLERELPEALNAAPVLLAMG